MQNLHVSPPKKEPLVSVIVTTKNEEKNIENCLKSIKNQTYPNIELIIVDNFSSDRTVEIAKKYYAKVLFKGTERSAQRNYGAEAATGKYLAYLDADMILSPNLIWECVQKCEQSGTDALYIPERIIGIGFWIKVRDFERSFYTGTVIDAVRFIRTAVFKKVGGFDESLIGPEDWDFDRKIRQVGYTGIINSPIYHNEGYFNMKKYIRKKEYYAEGVQRYIKKWGLNDSETIKQTSLQYRLFRVFIEKNRYKKLIMNPHLAFAMFFLRFRVALCYLKNL